MSSFALPQNVKRVIHTLVLWMPLWLGTTFLFGVVGGVYSVFIKQDQWLASQALLVREEANGATMRQGRFDSDAQMKAAQETILEVAKHHQVVFEALKVIGPKPGWIPWWGDKNWPTSSIVESIAKSSISIHAPKGAEFGATEVIYLDVKQPEPERSLKFSRALCDALEIRLQEVRKSKAESIVSELTHARDSARHQLKLVTEQLQKFERVAGIELSDLRGMTDMIAGGGNSRMQLDQLNTEIRIAETSHLELLDDLTLLQDAIANPSSLVVAPTAIVTSQPGLKRLREGYAEAQLSASQLSGKFTEEHPLLVAARTTQESIRDRLVNELEASLVGLNQEIKTSQQKLDRLRTLRSNTESKLGGLAENRAEYANVISEVKTRSTILETAERELAEAEASGEASSSTSLISRLDQAVVSDGPVGPGKTTITGACAIAGLLFGLGIVFVISPNENGKSFGRRITDLGRRKEDQSATMEKKPNIPTPNIPKTPERTAKVPIKVEPEVIQSKTAISDPIQMVVDKSIEEVQLQRLQQNLAMDHAEKRRERPAPVLYDETKIRELKKSNEPAIFSSVEEPTAEAIFEAYQLQDSAIMVPPMADEHPKDASFRDFLLSEIGKSEDRRQHPRPAETKTATPALSMRPSKQ